MTEFNDALIFLKQNDPRLGNLIDFLTPKYHKKIEDDFTSLVKIIIGQQLSGSVAKTIVSRVEKCLNTKTFNPQNIISLSNNNLRNCGISHSKINYIKNLSQILLHQSEYFVKLRCKNENEVLQELRKIKGIGVWTDQSLLWEI